MKTRDPESQEHFEGWFNHDAMSGSEWRAGVESELVKCRAEAADLAKEWLIKRGYFNGEITQEVNNVAGKQTHCKVTLTDFGLPNNADVDATSNEIASVLQMLDELAELWGDEGKFRACRDRLRKLVTECE